MVSDSDDDGDDDDDDDDTRINSKRRQSFETLTALYTGGLRKCSNAAARTRIPAKS